MLGFTVDEKALEKFGFQWIDKLLESKLASFVEIAPEKRAAQMSIYKTLAQSVSRANLGYQFHLPYFVHPTDYRLHSLKDSKQKIVNDLENWLILTDSFRYTDDRIPIILHPCYQESSNRLDQDLTAHFVELFLGTLAKNNLLKAYALTIENVPKRRFIGFGNSIASLKAFRDTTFTDNELALCLDLCHYVTNGDHSTIDTNAISVFHIHQFDTLSQQDHLSLSRGELDFSGLLEALAQHLKSRITVETLLYCNPNYISSIAQDLTLLQKALKY